MKNMTLRRIADECGGILHAAPGFEAAVDTEITSITTDSRKAGDGALFAAIVGERVDAHKFIPDVLAAGAACVLTEQDLPEETQGCWIRVMSTLQALKDIAEFYLRQLNIPVVGITGSVGKTSTKEMIASVLSQKYNALWTAGNFNNELGLPLTVFRLTDEHEIAVLEMGISNFGEMHRLAKIARPDTCVITNIGQCHLEFLGDRDGILRAKTEIFDFLKEDAHIVLNGDDDKLALVQNVEGIEPVRFGLKEDQIGDSVVWPEIGYWADNIVADGLEGMNCTIHTPDSQFDVYVPSPGKHQVMNALAATAVGRIYELTDEQIKTGIESLARVSGRFNAIKTDRWTVIDDCYNANPMSMKASLGALAGAKTRKVAVLGDMGELGADEKQMHAEVGSYAAQAGIDVIMCAGPLCENMAEAARAEIAKKATEASEATDAAKAAAATEAAKAAATTEAAKATAADAAKATAEGTDTAAPEQTVLWYENREAMMADFDKVLKDGDTILVKASHFMQFEKIVEVLKG